MLKDNCCHPQFAREGDKCTLCDKVLLDDYALVITTHVWSLGRTNWDDVNENRELTHKVRLAPDYTSLRRYVGCANSQRRVLLVMPKALTKDEHKMREFAQTYRFEILEV